MFWTLPQETMCLCTQNNVPSGCLHSSIPHVHPCHPQFPPSNEDDWSCQHCFITWNAERLSVLSVCLYRPVSYGGNFNVVVSNKDNMTLFLLTLCGFKCPEGMGDLTTGFQSDWGQSSHKSWRQSHHFRGAERTESKIDVTLIYSCCGTFWQKCLQAQFV